MLFTFDGQQYKQVKETPMDSSASSIKVNLFMEEKALHLYNTPYNRFFDDTFIWLHGKKQLHIFVIHISSIHQDLQFTVEVELQWTTALSVLVDRQSLPWTHYTERRHTNWNMLHANSFYHPTQFHSHE